MLYTVSGVQILATLDAFDDLSARFKGGKQKIGQCMFVSVHPKYIIMLIAPRYRRPAGP